MQKLYVDNFRGFEDTYVPLKDVNFLVGENSTGKSSILSLLSLMSEPQFWFNQSFNTPEIQLGSFTDIVSIEAKSRRHFSVGFMGTERDQTSKKHRCFAVHLRFVEKDGLPTIERYDVADGDRILRAEFRSSSGSYHVTQLPEHERAASSLEQRFKQWTRANSQEGAYENRLPKLPVARQHLLPILEGIIRSKGKLPAKDVSTFFRVPSQALAWIAPIRTKPHRTYDQSSLEFSSEGSHTPYLVRSLKKNRKARRPFEAFLTDFGDKSGLFHSLELKEFGSAPSSPFSLEVILSKKPLSLSNVGYGVSQSLPVIVEAFAREKKSIFAIQQPEVHLHPRAQAALGDLFFKLAVSEQKRFFIETHSDFTMDRFRLNYSKSSEKPDAQVLFFERTQRGNRVSSVEITESGGYVSDQPPAFRAFFMHEQLELLRVD